MTNEEKKKLILTNLEKYTLGVISTIHENNTPEAAVIGISQKDNLELIFDTFIESRKYKNIKSNPRVAIVVGWDDNITIQFEGIATELREVEREEYLQIHLVKIPSEIHFIKKGATLFKVIPKWVRFSDFRKEPSEIFELYF